jgi:hypothetical protein
MPYKITMADLSSLRYLYAFYSYLEYDIKLDLAIRASLREETKSLFNKYSSAVIKVAQHSEMLKGFQEIIEEFQESVRKESVPKKKYPKKGKVKHAESSATV